MEGFDVHEKESYFSAQPTIQPMPMEDSLYSISLEHNNPNIRPRPQTPPFPPTAALSSKTSDSLRSGTADRAETSLHTQSKTSERYSPPHSLSQSPERQNEKSRKSRSGSKDYTMVKLLAHETARANAAERKLSRDNEAIITRVRQLRDAQLQAETEVTRVTAELALYKLQLDLAQKEVRRAQAIVDRVEEDRLEAQERSIRDRERIRKLILERAVERAREEGRREGWQEGLERGRWRAWAKREVAEFYTDDEVSEEQPASVVSPSARSHFTVNKNGITNLTRDRVKDTSAAAARSQTNGPAQVTSNSIPVIAAPVPRRPLTSRPGNPTRSFPEDIQLYGSRTQASDSRAKTSPPKTQSTTVPPDRAASRRSLRSHYSIPPDGYIPTLGPGSRISLPPPHELGVRVEPITSQPGAEPADPSSKEGNNTKGEDNGHDRSSRTFRYEEAPERPPSSPRSTAASTKRESSSESNDVFRVLRKRDGQQTPALSTVSRASTRISQYDIVSPPDRQNLGSREEYGLNVNGRAGLARRHGVSRRGAQRSHNQNIEGSLSNSSESVESPTPKSKGHGKTARMLGETQSAKLDHGNETKIARSTERHPTNSRPHVATGSGSLVGASRVAPNPNPMVGQKGSYIYRSADRNETPSISQTLQSESYLNPRATVQRSISSVTVPGIDVQPPSHSPSNSSEGTAIDPVLLTPEHANRPAPLPEVFSAANSSSHEQQSFNHLPIIVGQLPPGFVPLSPIPTMTNLKLGGDADQMDTDRIARSGYQIYAGAGLVPATHIEVAQGLPSMGGSWPDPLSPRDVFGPRASIGLSSPKRTPVHSKYDSPAPLNRPFSIFSDD